MARSATVRVGTAFDSVLAAAQANAPWAFDRLWRAFAPGVVSYLRLQGAYDAEDLTSEVFLGAFRGLGSFRGDEGAFRGWLFTIAHRRIADERRRARVRPRWGDGGGEGEVPDCLGGDVEDDAFRYLSESEVRALCDQLVPAQRDVLLLRLLGDMTVEQAADALNKTPGAVKQLQRRGLTALRELFQREGVTL